MTIRFHDQAALAVAIAEALRKVPRHDFARMTGTQRAEAQRAMADRIAAHVATRALPPPKPQSLAEIAEEAAKRCGPDWLPVLHIRQL